MKSYIQKDIPGFYIETEEAPKDCGFSYEDFLDGKYIELSDDQVNYHADYPQDGIDVILNIAIYLDGEITYHVADAPKTLESVKEAKITELSEYDNSSAINDITINNTVHGWIDAETRANYRNSVDAAKLIGVETVSFFVDEQLFTVTTAQAEQMLAMIQLYADNCFIVTNQHKINIENLTTIEEVENYDFTVGYPEKLNFTV